MHERTFARNVRMLDTCFRYLKRTFRSKYINLNQPFYANVLRRQTDQERSV